ncbi:hypothetical protein PR202_gb21721 [Eleusine coracana subsp. coracana]|uniref:SKP1-like protein n=1 Tax=Eleusine coracana subsp. coracana TaxID=191504 RepID=A0AAV5FED9_ELECO|nr:hypothetical protein QOZ80_7BG0609310 [Eleusine coracana subsp. coracana]GJN33154.1 hypothetical protein PR202_gb21721 [Eleusine coracana subsp. coracana]
MAADGEKGAVAAATEKEKEKEVTGGRTITLKSNDEKPVEFEISLEAARLSGLLSQMIKSGSTAGGVRLTEIAAATLQKVVEYLNKHAEAGNGAVRAEDLKKWDAAFLDSLGGGRDDPLFDVILAANYLDIDGLLDAGCKRIADMMKVKTTEEIRDTFNIPDDFTPEEKVEMRRQHAWAFPKTRHSAASPSEDDDDDDGGGEEDNDDGGGDDDEMEYEWVEP